MTGGHTHIAVGLSGGAMAVYDEETFEQIKFAIHCKEDIDELKYAPNGKYLAVGSHDNYVDLLDVANDYAMLCRLAGHSSYIKHIDWSADSTMLQTNCGAHELLYWKLWDPHPEGEGGGGPVALRPRQEKTSSAMRDVKWHSQTTLFGWHMRGLWPEDADGTDVNACARSNVGSRDLVATSDDFGKVKLFRYPCASNGAPSKSFSGHAAHVTPGFLSRRAPKQPAVS